MLEKEKGGKIVRRLRERPAQKRVKSEPNKADEIRGRGKPRRKKN